MRYLWSVLRGTLVLGCASIALATRRGAAQQEIGLSPPAHLIDRGPAFFSVAAPRGERVDAHNAAVFRRRVALDLAGASIPAALDALISEAGVHITYRESAFPTTARVTLRAQSMTVAAALTEILLDAGVDVQLLANGALSLVPRDPGTHPARPTAVQNGSTLTGRITDAVTHAPLDQVAVRVEGPGLGALTAADGRYTVHNVPSGTYRVTARRVGYTPSTATLTAVTDSTITVDFALVAAATKLNEVVTTAVGDQRRYQVGNVISTINADSIAPTAPITSLTDLMSARAPGVVVEETGGLTGSGEAIRIRGQSSLVLQGDPIVIVDGARQDNTPGGTATLPVVGGYLTAVPSPSRLNDLDFNDIETIDVLKGPTASTEYGTDAANGVIVITTKHGTAGRPQWYASAEKAASEIPENFPTLYYRWGHTTDARHTTVQCPLAPYVFGSGYGSGTGTCAVDSVTTWDPLNNSYYSIFGAGSRQKYDLSVSGGSDATRYFVAGRLSNEIGVLRMPGVFVPEAEALGVPHSVFRPNGEDQRSVRANTAIRLGTTADLTVTGAYLSTYQATPNAESLYSGVVLFPPLRDSANGYGYGYPSQFIYSPIYQLANWNNQNTGRLTGGLTANWRPAPWFVGHGTVGVDHGSQRNVQSVLPQVARLWPYVPSQLGIANAITDTYTMDLRGSMTAALTRTVRAVTSIGLQLADTRMQGTTVTATGITATNFTVNGAVNPTVVQLGDRQATLGGYGEEQLGLSDRLFLTGAVRIDAGSGFGHTYSTAVYPKASASWLIVNSGPTTVRVRAAFGESGVQPPNGSALQLYAPTTVAIGGGITSAVAVANVQNQRLQPEQSKEYEGGLDLGLWQNRASVELSAYSKTTNHALVSAGTGWEGGGLPYEENVGEIRNEGVEGTLAGTLVDGQTLRWDMTLNASVNRNKLVALEPGVLSQQLRGIIAVYRFAPGYPLYGYWAPRVQYADLNRDGVIQPTEVTVAKSLSYVGSSLPTREASLGTHVGLWGGAVSAGALIDYRGGFRLMNSTAAYEATVNQSDRASNDRTAPLSQQARDVAGVAINVTGGATGYAPAAGFYEDATYVRFRELSLTYEVSRPVARVLRARSVSLTAAVRNLALWTRYTGADPEVTNSAGYNAQLSPTSNIYSANNDMREDFITVPLLRYWVVRLNLGL